MDNLTQQQRNAVVHREKTLLVSAGAGSGKTSTLSKRIISRISDPHDNVEIDDFLIVTFTNASAKDLSEKIEKAVSEAVANDITNKKENNSHDLKYSDRQHGTKPPLLYSLFE